MLRINLLPREVLERRRYEGWYRWVAILAIGLILIVLGVYVLLLLTASGKAGQLQTVQESARQYSATAQTLSIFENKEQELVKREGVAQVALAGRINMGETANEISLVLPDEVWLDGLTINESTGLVLTANTPRSSSESMDIAYKSVAKTLVRINELPDIIDVWLTTAANTQWGKWAPKPQSATSAPPPLPVNVVGFQASGKVLRPIVATATAPAAAPAPVPVPAPTSGTTQ
jgi:hypothetical protein